MNIIQILHLDVGLIHSKHLTPTPDKLIILAIRLDNVDKIILFKGIGPLVVREVVEVVVRLGYGKSYVEFVVQLVVGLEVVLVWG